MKTADCMRTAGREKRCRPITAKENWPGPVTFGLRKAVELAVERAMTQQITGRACDCGIQIAAACKGGHIKPYFLILLFNVTLLTPSADAAWARV